MQEQSDDEHDEHERERHAKAFGESDRRVAALLLHFALRRETFWTEDECAVIEGFAADMHFAGWRRRKSDQARRNARRARTAERVRAEAAEVVERARAQVMLARIEVDILRHKLAERDRTIGTLATLAEAFAVYPPITVDEEIGGIVHDAVRRALEPASSQSKEAESTQSRRGDWL